MRMAHFDFLVRYSVTYGRRSTVLMAMEDVAAACQMLVRTVSVIRFFLTRAVLTLRL